MLIEFALTAATAVSVGLLGAFFAFLAFVGFCTVVEWLAAWSVKRDE